MGAIFSVFRSIGHYVTNDYQNYHVRMMALYLLLYQGLMIARYLVVDLTVACIEGIISDDFNVDFVGIGRTLTC